MVFLSKDYEQTSINIPEKILTGIDAGLYSLSGMYNRSFVKGKLLKQAEEIVHQEKIWEEKSTTELQKELLQFKEIFQRQKKGYEKHLPTALAALREAAYRCLKLRPYKVQIAGSLALYRGFVAEMATGEGKTLTATLTAVIHGWTQKPCHIITVNDYLAQRDAQKHEAFYSFCHVSVGYVTSVMDTAARRASYAKDVVYTTSKEIVADFLRDRLIMGNLQQRGRRQVKSLFSNLSSLDRNIVMRGIHTAIVDEADSVLIDEAVTPLIISRPQPNIPFIEACKTANSIASYLKEGEDYIVDQRLKRIDLTPEFEERLLKQREEQPMLKGPGRRKEFIRQALHAKEFFHLDKQYIIHEGKIVIVDEFTGRLMHQRSWQSGLHQLVEAKEGLEITAPSETLARLSFQRFFRFFKHLSGMTGTASEASGELWHIYGLPVVTIPFNKDCQREQYSQKVFSTEKEKWDAIITEIEECHKSGRPVLVGTRSVQKSEYLVDRLERMGYQCQLLNAVRNEQEADIIAAAGEGDAITVATNMAGRGTDIMLDSVARKSGGLHVIITECHESGRVDRQFFGRSGRQGDPGSARSFVSMEDELVIRYLTAPIRNSIQNLLKGKIPSSQMAAHRAVNSAQNKAQKIAYKRRKAVLKTDTWLDDSLSFTENDIS